MSRSPLHGFTSRHRCFRTEKTGVVQSSKVLRTRDLRAATCGIDSTGRIHTHHRFKTRAFVFRREWPANQLLGRLAPLSTVEFVLVVGGTIVTVTLPCSKLSQPSRSAVRTKYWPETVAA